MNPSRPVALDRKDLTESCRMARHQHNPPDVALSETPKLQQVVARLRLKIPPDIGVLAEAFARQLFGRDGAAYLAERDADQLAALAGTAFQFVAQRTAAEPRVRVFNPVRARDGWEVPCTVIETVMHDRPFIVDTLRETLRRAGCVIERLLHPVFGVQRSDGKLVDIGPAEATGCGESFVHVEIERVADLDKLSALLQKHLGAVVLATDDYQAMRARAAELVAELRTRALPPPWNSDLDEIAAFLEWLGEKSFVFLGYREYQFFGAAAERTAEVRHGSGLGISRLEEGSSYASPRRLPEALRRRLNSPPLLLISKTNADSPIHRAGHMDYIGIKDVDANGEVVGERRFLGLFTCKAYAEESALVPLLRRKLRTILEAEGALEDSYNYKAIVTVFNSIPKIELMAGSVAELRAAIALILAAEGGKEVKVLKRPDALGRGVFVTLILPRERFSNELQRRIETRLIRALAGIVLEQHLVMDERDQVRLHFYIAALTENVRTVSAEELRTQCAGLLRTWDDRLSDLLLATYEREHARTLIERYTLAFSNAYKAATDVGTALADIRGIEALRTTRQPQVDLINEPADERFTTVKLYIADFELVLSDFLPVLENLGLRVFGESSVSVTVADLGAVRVHTFLVQDRGGARLDVAAAAPLLKPALLMLQAGAVENDRLNALILRAGLSWRQVDLLRTYVLHGVQIGTAPTPTSLMLALIEAPQSARILWEYFEAKFNPQRVESPDDRLTSLLPPIERRFTASLESVQSVAEDRMLRALFSAFAATLRTNFFSAPANLTPDTNASLPGAPQPALAVKLAGGRIAHMPRPHPAYEIYVHARHVEALHLRGAPVARGGIRLSDRPDDFRTEILDLMKTQTVKNAVIVPAGAKGGFVPKHRPGTLPGADQITAGYRTFISTLLDLTDNVIHGQLAPAAGIVCYDGPDPYLVVAADKGTAALSDIANAVAAQHQFWLGDAFASGGAHGYDHKKQGITARGTWECVRRHFREMGRDADRDELTMIGIGDMSGDVFGNGLLLSRHVRLRAAFNHLHIFLDHDPDPERAFLERQRLFGLPHSSWADYDTARISPGGGVFARAAKKVPLSPAAQDMLGIAAEFATGEEVVRAILRMEADLLWNGGIGTYVKAGNETHADVGDSSNDTARVNGAELRVSVVAEGGNLGFTQRGRIEYALRGGRINSDAIDNSAGVDMSDHEVNLKIALAGAVESGQLTFAERNQLLTDLAPEVMRRVLAHNVRQARILSLDQLHSQTDLSDFRELMVQMESEGLLDRQFENLPDRDTLRSRRSVFLGLTRPELAVILAYSKLYLQHRVLASRLPDDDFFAAYLRAYFPAVIDQRFGDKVHTHRLRREIVAVEAANALIDTMGSTFVTRVGRDTGVDAVAVVRSWAVAVAVSDTAGLWNEIGTTPLPPAAEIHSWLMLRRSVERACKWLIETQPPELTAGQLSDQLRQSTVDLLAVLARLLPPTAQAGLTAAIESMRADGVPLDLAERIAPLERLSDIFEIGHIARSLQANLALAAQTYYWVGEQVDFEWVRQSLVALPAVQRWDRRAVEGLTEGLGYARRQLTCDVLRCAESGPPTAWLRRHETDLGKLRALINDIKSARQTTLSALLVIMREIGRLASGRST